MEFDSRLKQKSEIKKTESAKKLAKFHRTILSWVKQIVLVVYIVVLPYM